MPNINNSIDYLSTVSFELVEKATFNKREELRAKERVTERGRGTVGPHGFTLRSLRNDDETNKWRKRLLKSEFALFQNSSLL